ncbi:hypothetical protein ACP70R_011310 [Stipagrostis hirtigluma subsp. patula]
MADNHGRTTAGRSEPRATSVAPRQAASEDIDDYVPRVFGQVLLRVSGVAASLRSRVGAVGPRRPVHLPAAISGLDDSVPRKFNLTLSIDNLADTEFEVCMGGEAVVLYGGVPLAVGRVQELCVPRKGAADLDIVAASGGVGLPEALAELMAGEKRADGAVHVEVRVISETAKHRWFLSCAAALGEEPTRPYPCEKAILVDESDGVRPDDN